MNQIVDANVKNIFLTEKIFNTFIYKHTIEQIEQSKKYRYFN